MKCWVTVHPNSKNPGIEKDLVGELHVRVKQIPRKGKANRAVVKALARHFKVANSQVHILSGFKSKRKLVEIIRQH